MKKEKANYSYYTVENTGFTPNSWFNSFDSDHPLHHVSDEETAIKQATKFKQIWPERKHRVVCHEITTYSMEI